MAVGRSLAVLAHTQSDQHMYFWQGRIGQLLARSGTTLRRSHVRQLPTTAKSALSRFRPELLPLRALLVTPTFLPSSPTSLPSNSVQQSAFPSLLRRNRGPEPHPAIKARMLIGS
ncbi:hypothetical protein BDV06DRAFT_114502 [Aspergillus oleicola]